MYRKNSKNRSQLLVSLQTLLAAGALMGTRPSHTQSSPSASKLEFPVSTKIWRTQCVNLEENNDKSVIVFSVKHSRLAFSLSAGDKDFIKFKPLLKEACQDTSKKIDLRYDEATQKIVMLRFSK